MENRTYNGWDDLFKEEFVKPYFKQLKAFWWKGTPWFAFILPKTYFKRFR